MYRELDKCTQYILKKLEGFDREKLLANVIFFRFFNQANLYEKLGIEPFDKIDEKCKKKITAGINKLILRKEPLFNNAYIISGETGKKKHISILDNMEKIKIDELTERLDKSKFPEESLKTLTMIPQVGRFLACEIWTDLSYFGFFRQGWNDDDFVNIGPGAKWGLEIIHGKSSKKELQKRLFHLHLIQRKVLPEIHKELGENLSWEEISYKEAFSNKPFLSLTNIEGALCEFRKYWRLKEGKGKKRYFHKAF
jgi:hypothetical protein